MVMTQPFISQFTITGELTDLEAKSKDCIKTLYLVSERGEYTIKVAKELRKKLNTKLKPGYSIEVTGIRKNEIHKQKISYKAYNIKLLRKPVSETAKSPSSKKVTAIPKAKVLFCQKSTCWKNGGRAAFQCMKEELENKGIAERVEMKTVGCLKQCKKAPNIVIMPDKARYSRVKPKQVSNLVEKHLIPE